MFLYLNIFASFTVLNGVLSLPLVNESNDKTTIFNEFDSQNPEELGDFFEGDIVPSVARNGLVDEAARWPNGIVPYAIGGNFGSRDLETIMNAINLYNKYTCISFRPKTRNDVDYIFITNYNSGCWSPVGRMKNKQLLNLESPSCTTKLGTAVHELMHSIGFFHEQNRYNRDDFVTINWDNIEPNKKGNFNKTEKGITEDFGVNYDFNSVMHYSTTAFTKNGKKTITPNDAQYMKSMGQRRGFSLGDISKINAMYGCPEKTTQLNLTSESIVGESAESPTHESNQNSLWGAFHNLFAIFDHK